MKSKKDKPTNRVSYGIGNMLEDVMGNLKVFMLSMIFTFLLSILAVSYLTQIVTNIFSDNKKISFIGLFTAWTSHPVTILLTIVLFVTFTFSAYKLRLIFKQDRIPNYDDNYETAESSEYGKSHWAGEEEKEVMLDRSPDFMKIKGDILGFEGEVIATHGDKHTYHISNICSMKAGLLSTNYNKIIFGSAGSGKSAAVVYNDIIQAMKRGDSVIATDSKGDVYRETAAIMHKHGYLVRILNLKPEELANSDAWEPLKYVSATTEEEIQASEIQADVLAQAIITNTLNGARMDFWADNEKNCLKATILLVAQTADYEGRRSMGEVANIVSDPERFDSKFVNLPEDSPAKRAFNIYSVAKDDVKKQILNGMAIRLQLLNNPYVKAIMSHDEMDLILPMKRKCIYYICISDTDTTMKFVAAMFFTQIFQAQCNYSDSLGKEEKKKQLRVVYELDEFKNIGSIPDFDTKISTFRSRKISSTLILQNISQLKQMFPMEQHQTILGNTTTHILLKAGDTDTAQHFTDLCGKTTVRIENSRYDKKRSQIVDLHDEEGVTEGLGQRDILMMNEAMQLSPDDMIVCIMGFPPLRLHKYITELYNPIFKEEFKEMKPNRHRPKWMKELMEAKQKDKEYIEQLRKERDNKANRENNGNNNKREERSLPDPRNTSDPSNKPNKLNKPNKPNKPEGQENRNNKNPGNGQVPRNNQGNPNTQNKPNNQGNKGNNNNPQKPNTSNIPNNRPKPDNSSNQKKNEERNQGPRPQNNEHSNNQKPRRNFMNITEDTDDTENIRGTDNTKNSNNGKIINRGKDIPDEIIVDDRLPGDSEEISDMNVSDERYDEASDEDMDETSNDLSEEDIQDEPPEEEVNTTKGDDMFGAMFSDGDFF